MQAEAAQMIDELITLMEIQQLQPKSVVGGPDPHI
jgi:hypothetical protein